MSEPRDLALVRNAIAVLGSLDRHEVEPIDDREWVAFRDGPCRAFLTMSGDRRQRVWRAIQARLPERLRETLNPMMESA